MMIYDFNEDRHRYAVWTAARAVQRNFTTTQNISTAIDSSGLREFAESNQKISQDDFDEWHKQCANALMDNFGKSKTICRYGRAAKIIAIYLKTSVIISGGGECKRSTTIHPPIDRILLKGIANQYDRPEWKDIKWTELDQNNYWNLVSEIRNKAGSFDWRLEVAWTSVA